MALEYPPLPERMKSDQVRVNWRDVLQRTRSGGTVEIEHYNEPIGRIEPYASTAGITLYTVTLTRKQWRIVGERDRGLTRVVKATQGEIDDMPVTVRLPLSTAATLLNVVDVQEAVRTQLDPQIAEAERVAKLRRDARRTAIRANVEPA